MANEQNLRPGEYHLSKEEAKKGGLASAESRRKKRDLRMALELLLEREIKQGNEVITGAQALSARLYKEALQGNVRAFEVLRDTVGQKPVEKVMIAEVDQTVIDEVERAVLDG
jgi:hypothetical protein